MTRIFGFCLRSADSVLALLTALACASAQAGTPERISIHGIGDLDAGIARAKDGVWRPFHEDGSVLLSVRAESWKRPEGRACSVYLRGIRSVPDGAVIPHTLEKLHQALEFTELPDLPPWEPFSEEDRLAIERCDALPCDVKVSAQEAVVLRKTPVRHRKKAWQALVFSRGDRYRSQNRPEGYGEQGYPVDAWQRLEGMGLQPALPRIAEPELLLRMLNLGEGRLRPFRQTLDRRHSIGKTQSSAWIRAVYTERYFDSWGEVLILDCPDDDAPLRMVHALLVDFDPLRSKGFLDWLLKWKNRGAFEAQSQRYLDQVAEYVKKR